MAKFKDVTDNLQAYANTRGITLEQASVELDLLMDAEKFQVDYISIPKIGVVGVDVKEYFINTLLAFIDELHDSTNGDVMYVFTNSRPIEAACGVATSL